MPNLVAQPLIEEQISLSVADKQYARLIRLYKPEYHGPAVFMLHGLMDDARCFHNSQTRTGLAYVLARRGYDVYMGELRGRRLQGRAIRKHDFSMDQAVNNDLKRLVTGMQKRARAGQQFWIGQGYGCLLMSSFLARNPLALAQVTGLVHFSPFSRIQNKGVLKRLWVELLHRRLLTGIARVLGYVPAQKLRLGRSNESLRLFQGAWRSADASWVAEDGLDYPRSIQALDWPPSLYFATQYPAWLDESSDARAFMFDLGSHNGQLIKLGRKVGNQQNYRRGELCLNQAAEQDYYPLLLEWMDQLAATGQTISDEQMTGTT